MSQLLQNFHLKGGLIKSNMIILPLKLLSLPLICSKQTLLVAPCCFVQQRQEKPKVRDPVYASSRSKDDDL